MRGHCLSLEIGGEEAFCKLEGGESETFTLYMGAFMAFASFARKDRAGELYNTWQKDARTMML